MSYSIINTLVDKGWGGRWRERERKQSSTRKGFLIATMYNNNKDTLKTKCSFFNAFIFTFRYLFHLLIGTFGILVHLVFFFKIKFYPKLKKKKKSKGK